MVWWVRVMLGVVDLLVASSHPALRTYVGQWVQPFVILTMKQFLDFKTALKRISFQAWTGNPPLTTSGQGELNEPLPNIKYHISSPQNYISYMFASFTPNLRSALLLNQILCIENYNFVQENKICKFVPTWWLDVIQTLTNFSHKN